MKFESSLPRGNDPAATPHSCVRQKTRLPGLTNAERPSPVAGRRIRAPGITDDHPHWPRVTVDSGQPVSIAETVSVSYNLRYDHV